MGGRRRLTEQHLDEMAALREAGKSFQQITRHFARQGITVSPGAVSWQCLRIGADAPPAQRQNQRQFDQPYRRGRFVVRPFTEQEDALLLSLEAKGLGDTAIGREIGRAPNSIRGRLMVLARREARAEESA